MKCRKPGAEAVLLLLAVGLASSGLLSFGRERSLRGSRAGWQLSAATFEYMDAQLTELLTQYGEIGGIWFDGMWDKPDADWRLREPTT